MKHKILLSVVAVLLTALSAQAYNFQSGNLYYNITSGNTVEVTYLSTSSSNYSGLTSAIIPSSVTYNETTYNVTSIGNNAFCKCSGLTSVTIPNSVTSIGGLAFINCSGLTSITIPNSVTSIGVMAFMGCSSLTSIVVESGNTMYDSRENCNAIIETASNTLIAGCQSTTIPNSVTSIGSDAFSSCSGLTSVTIPNSVTSIGFNAFRDCSGLTSVTIGNSVTSIGGGAFYDCSGLTSVNLVTPSSITEIASSAFSGTAWFTNKPNGVVYLGDVLYKYKGSMPPNTSVIVNSETKTINRSAFSSCSGLTAITIPNSVTSIGESAFSSCSGLTSITIPNSVTSIGRSAFSSCSGLTSVTIPNSVTSIGSGVFYGCSGLTSITIPNSVTSIGGSAFSGCTHLTSITCEAKTPPSCDISSNDNSFESVPANCTIKVPCGYLEAYNTAPWSNYQLTIIPPPSLQVQPSNESLGSTTIDQEVDCDSTAIVSATPATGYHFVQWSDGITDNPRTIKLTKDSTLTAEFEIISSGQCGDSLYWSYANNELSITGKGAMSDYATNTMPWLLFIDSTHTIRIAENTTYIGNNAFYGCSSLTSVNLGNGVQSIGESAFGKCTNLVSISMSESLKNIGNSAFYDCSSLTSIAIPDGVTSIDKFAFCGCTNLSSIAIPESVTSIGQSAFGATAWYNNQPDGEMYINTILYSFKGIMRQDTSISVLPGTTSICGGAFYNCTYLTSITIPNSVTSIGQDAFGKCDGLDTITIGQILNNRKLSDFFPVEYITMVTLLEGVDTIGNKTFDGCSDLTTLTIPSSVDSIGEGTFSDCTITSITCKAKTPPACNTNSFTNVHSGCTITIPCGCSEAYDIAPWNQFNLSEIVPPSLQVQSMNEAWGTAQIDTDVDCDSVATISATPIYGYHFVQWSDADTSNPRTIKLTKDSLLKASFARNSYSIALTVSGGGSISGETTALYQDTITLAATADYGWQFSGWSDGVTANPRSVVITADCSYQANFVRQQFSITATAENGSVSGVGSFAYEDTCSLTATPATGYHFVQWSDGITANPRTIILTKDSTLTAEFEKNSYSIALTVSGEGSISGETTALYQDTITLAATADYGWQFSGWSDGVLDNPRSIVVTANCAYRAIFVKRNFTIATAGENGTIAGGGTYAYETNCSLTATPAIGYHFVQWSDGVTENPRTIILTKDSTLTAEFEKNSYSIALTVSGEGSISGETTALYQDTITLAATADYGWQFSGWSDGVTANPRSVVITADCSYQANFVRQQFSITATAENGSVSGVGSFAYEDTCSLTATPATGYHFVQWSDGVTENPRSIVLTKDTNLTAEFAKNSYSIALTVSGEGSISGETTALYQDTITLAATADYGWQFSGWSDGVLDNPRSIVVTADCEYHAIFVRQQFSLTAIAENGVVDGVGTFAYEDTCQLTATPNTGYHFVQWSDGVTENPRSIVLTKDTNLTAEFAKNAYNITLTHEGEGAIEGDTTALYQDTIALTAVADYGWQFSGWSDGITDNPRTVVVSSDCAYQAIFVKRSFTITVAGENGTIEGAGTFEYETTCQLTATPNTGYHFVQWSDGITENPRSIVLTKDTNLTAEFAKNAYNITLTHDGEGAIEGDTTALYQDTIALNAVADYGWQFSGWSDGVLDNPRSIVVTADCEYHAIFVRQQFSLTAIAENGVVDGVGTFAYEDTCQLTATPNTGYHFVQWSDGVTENPRSIVLTKDTNLTAEFAKNSYQITTSHTGNGTTMGDTTALYQDTITLSALADNGWDFSGWEDGNTENPRVVVATEDKDYKAIFVKRMFTITLTGENGSFEGAGSFAYGDTCQLTAIANVGYHFVQWSDSITDNPRSIVLTKDTNLTAEFAKNYFGQCGDSLYWIYDTTTISIIGSGAMYNYTDSFAPWYLFCDSITAIEMVNTATTIGDYAFANCNKLSKLMIGESMESVGSNAFMGCTQLTNITCHPIIPPYVETSSFENYDTYLRVPCSSKSQYMADAVWGQFKYIECIEEETDIESVESESSEQSVRKIYRDGNVYIIRDGEEYSILGQKL